jgi:hypothetical protein
MFVISLINKRTHLRAHRNLPYTYLGMSKILITNNYGKWQIWKKLSEISKFRSFEYKIIWQTLISTKWYQLQQLSMCLSKVMAIPDFFEKFLKIVIQENSKILNFEYKVICAQNDTKFNSLACNQPISLKLEFYWIFVHFFLNFNILSIPLFDHY